MAANPSHLLISRNPRSPAHPQLAPGSTATSSPYTFPFPADDAGASGASAGGASASGAGGGAARGRHVRSRSTPALDLAAEEEEEAEPLAIHPTFARGGELPGRVLVRVAGYEFWCHREVLWFASPFFNALLRGPWAETGGKGHARGGSLVPTHRSHGSHSSGGGSTSAGVSEDAPTSSPADDPAPDPTAELAGPDVPDTDTLGQPEDGGEGKGSVYLDAQDGPSVAEILAELRSLPEPPEPPVPQALRLSPDAHDAHDAHDASPTRPAASPLSSLSSSGVLKPKAKRASTHAPHSATPPRPCSAPAGAEALAARGADCVVELKEESPEAFQDFLFWAYPHLDCKATWTNVEGLLALSLKLIVPSLTKLCEQFLMTHASGRPVVALSLAEQHGNAELYREASRFLLDQPTWDPAEFESLSEATQLKLSKRRTWFLERLLKLGTIDVRKEYTCRPDCPDPSRCQQQLDEKWRQAYLAVSRYGPPQASVAFRCLRQLETFPTNPSLVMPHPLCQSSAKSWVSTLFDRMFQPKVAFGLVTPGTEKYWLHITLN